ncbi:hypothetical protein ABZP36_009453 [Zizania latifolia]
MKGHHHSSSPLPPLPAKRRCAAAPRWPPRCRRSSRLHASSSPSSSFSASIALGLGFGKHKHRDERMKHKLLKVLPLLLKA